MRNATNLQSFSIVFVHYNLSFIKELLITQILAVDITIVTVS
jgi:hypothetical protein